MVGFFKTDKIHRNAELGIFIGESEYWGKGIGVEVMNLMLDYGFDTLNFHKIVACCNTNNTRSLGMCKKLGFIEEGHQKEMEFIDGKWGDLIWFGMLKKER